MEQYNRRLQGCLAALGFLILILDSRQALEGARSGMELCMKTVIPSLFPFFVLSGMLTNALGHAASRPTAALCRLLGIPATAASVLIPSFLGGYPVGAKCVGTLYETGQIDRHQGERMLAFCSNAGPSFLFGMVSGFFPEGTWIWLLWLVLISGAVLTAAAIPASPYREQATEQKPQREKQTVLSSAAKAMGMVCCWVVLFRMVLAFLEAWVLWALPGWAQVLVSGILELTNGCCGLMLIEDLRLRFLLCACMLSFGGICVLLQTASVIHGLSLGSYLRGKLIQTAFTFLLSCAVVLPYGLFFAGGVPLLVMLLRKNKIRYGNPGIFPV